jgi:MFS family permease
MIISSSSSDSLLFIILGLPTWALVDGTWSSLSELANHVPEGYDISAYLILSLTIGNIFPMIIGYIMEKYHSRDLLSRLMWVILIIGFLCGILLGIIWNMSITISGSKISLPLCILFFVVGTCSSSSNVTHYMYVSTFPAHNTSALGTGMGIGSMISGLLGILQGAWLIDYGFTTTIYYIVLSLLYLPAMMSFFILRKNRTKQYKEEDPDHFPQKNDNNVDNDSGSFDQVQYIPLFNTVTEQSSSSTGGASNWKSFLSSYYSILLLQLLNSSLGYGFVPALISYACGKFPNARTILLFSTGIAAIIDPWFKFLTNYYRFTTFPQLLFSTCILFLFVLGLIICSVLPSSSHFYSKSNGALPAFFYVSFMGLFGFTNICIFRYFKQEIIFTELKGKQDTAVHTSSKGKHSDEEKGVEYVQEESDLGVQHAYRYSGIASQTGALLGSAIAFSLVISKSL